MGALAALWGASYMFIKIALDDGMPAPSVVFTRVLLGALVLTPIALRRGAFGGLRGLTPWVLAVAAAQVAVPFLLITYAERWIPTSLAGILVATTAIFVAILSPFFDRASALHGWAIGGTVVGIVGVTLLFGVDLSGEAKLALGGAMVLAASIGYAFASIWVRTKLGTAQPVAIAAGTLIAASLMTLPPAIAQAPGHTPSPGAVAALIGLGAGGTGIAFLIYYMLIADIGASRASVVAYLAPGFSVFYGALFLDESITVATIAGLALILLGSWIAAEGRAPWQRKPVVAPAVSPVAARMAGEPLAEDLVSRT